MTESEWDNSVVEYAIEGFGTDVNYRKVNVGENLIQLFITQWTSATDGKHRFRINKKIFLHSEYGYCEVNFWFGETFCSLVKAKERLAQISERSAALLKQKSENE